ncbi:MAG: TRAP transporter small permease [Desulfuromonadales bacterium]|jgi:TRAP-type transport system small permease protein
MMPSLLTWIDRGSKIAAYLSAMAMLVIVALISVEIGARSLFNSSTLIADEYSGYLMVAVVMLGLSYTLAEDGHIRITILTSRLQGKPQCCLDLAVIAVALVMCGFFLYHATLLVYDSYSYDMRADSISETPVYLPQMMVVIGFLSLTLQLVARFFRRLLSFPTP